jgi:hypothetical protein
MSPPIDTNSIMNSNEYDEAVCTQVPESVDDLRTWFKPAVHEIRELILKDSWPRFRRSPYFPEVRAAYLNRRVFVNSARGLCCV